MSALAPTGSASVLADVPLAGIGCLAELALRCSTPGACFDSGKGDSSQAGT